MRRGRSHGTSGIRRSDVHDHDHDHVHVHDHDHDHVHDHDHDHVGLDGRRQAAGGR
jgi:hypothetical protein